MYEIKPVIFNLSNGIRVVYLHAPSQVAHLGITVLGGARFEKDKEDERVYKQTLIARRG